MQAAVRKLSPSSLAGRIEGALVVVSDMPGPEVVAEGVDPHVGVLVDDLLDEQRQGRSPTGATRSAPVACSCISATSSAGPSSGRALEDEVLRTLEHELALTFPGRSRLAERVADHRPH